MRIGIIGFGYWGKILARCFSQAPHLVVSGIADITPTRRGEGGRQYPEAFLTTKSDELLGMSTIDAVVIATPSNTHHDIAKAALEAGKHVWVEKPAAETADRAKALARLAQERGCVLFIDHTFIYSDGIRLIKETLSRNGIGAMRRYHSVRVNNGQRRDDASIFHDLAIHDLAILDFLVGEKPLAVSVSESASHTALAGDPQYIELIYPSRIKARICVDWCAPAKTRRVIISSKCQSIEFDDLEVIHKVKLYDFPFPFAPEFGMRCFGRSGSQASVLPLENPREALSNAIEDFLHCVRTGGTPASDGWQGARLAAILDACLSSAQTVGKWTEVSSIE